MSGIASPHTSLLLSPLIPLRQRRIIAAILALQNQRATSLRIHMSCMTKRTLNTPASEDDKSREQNAGENKSVLSLHGASSGLTPELSDGSREGRWSAPDAPELPPPWCGPSGAAVRSSDLVRHRVHVCFFSCSSRKRRSCARSAALSFLGGSSGGSSSSPFAAFWGGRGGPPADAVCVLGFW